VVHAQDGDGSVDFQKARKFLRASNPPEPAEAGADSFLNDTALEIGKYVISDKPMTEEQWTRERATLIDVTPDDEKQS
jgi:hypothetical protein